MMRSIIDIGVLKNGTRVTLQHSPHQYMKDAVQLHMFEGNTIRIEMSYVEYSILAELCLKLHDLCMVLYAGKWADDWRQPQNILDQVNHDIDNMVNSIEKSRKRKA